jgi:hypothetical protein
MKLEDIGLNCQMPCLQNLAAGKAQVPPESIKRKLRLFLRRHATSRQVRLIKMKSTQLINWIVSKFPKKTVDGNKENKTYKLNTGDLVRVRSEEEIRSTLNLWGQLKGCMLIPEMLVYCGTTQKVLKRLERFVDERDYQVKKSNGIVLLEGIHCKGTSDYGRCDRTCFYFWPEEWLEKIDESETHIANNKRLGE